MGGWKSSLRSPESGLNFAPDAKVPNWRNDVYGRDFLATVGCGRLKLVALWKYIYILHWGERSVIFVGCGRLNMTILKDIHSSLG